MTFDTASTPLPPPPSAAAEELGSPSTSSGSSKPRLLIQRTHAAFVSKLYAMVADASTNNLISWTTDGDCFKVTDPTEFARVVLPVYFKHGNWPSFVRQLNMYGFHKINDLAYGGIFGDTQLWMFKNPHFKRGELGQLQCIKRRGPKTGTSATSADASADTAVATAAAATEPSESRSTSPSSPAMFVASHPTSATASCLEHEVALSPDQLVSEPVPVAAQSMGDYVGDLKNCISELQQSNGQLRRENQEMRTAVKSCQNAFAGIMGFLEATIVQPCLHSDSPPGSRNAGTDVVQAFRRLAGELAPLIAPRDYPPSSNSLPQPNSECFPLASRRAAAPPLTSSFCSSSSTHSQYPALPPIRFSHGPQFSSSPRLPSLSPSSQVAALTSDATESRLSRKRRSSSGSDTNSSANSIGEVKEEAGMSPVARIVLPPISGIVDNIPDHSPHSKAANRWQQYPISTTSSLRETMAVKRIRPSD
ncbi:Flocculation suppression protein [Coemansia aciculifera]|nr:Flocculation suppression protein [Coemansia aciculifera]